MASPFLYTHDWDRTKVLMYLSNLVYCLPKGDEFMPNINELLRDHVTLEIECLDRIYLNDDEFGPGFIKIYSYVPFPIKVYINGHEWVKRQLEKKAIAFERKVTKRTPGRFQTRVIQDGAHPSLHIN